MKETITVLQMYPSSQVAKEKLYMLDDYGYITLDDGTTYKLRPNRIMFRGDQPYAILMAGLGFIASQDLSVGNFNGAMS